MGRLSDRDVDALTQMQYEDALADDEPWALEALAVRQWASLHGKRVAVEFDDGSTAEGVWEWHGARRTGLAPDDDQFYLVYINDRDGRLIVGTDARNFDKVTVLHAAR